MTAYQVLHTSNQPRCPHTLSRPSLPLGPWAVSRHTAACSLKRHLANMAAEEPFPLLPITSSETIRKCAVLELRARDVFVASYPKSGTTWMQHIVHTLATDGNSPLPHVSDACPFFEVDRTWEPASDGLTAAVCANHEKINCRIFNTHLRWRMMPQDSPDARYVYMTRRAVDACVSFYHHLSHQAEADGGYSGTLEAFIDDWTHGRAPFGSWSAHLRSWLGATAGDERRILVISYEELKADPRACVLRVNAHCGFGLSDARIDELLPRFSFEWMRANESQFHPRSVRWERKAEDGEDFHFIRKGQVGDGDTAFGPAQLASLRHMAETTWGAAGPPADVAKLLPA